MKDAPVIVVLTREHWLFLCIILGLGIYFTGFLISALYNVPYYFFKNWYFGLASIGIILVTSMWNWGFASIDGAKEELKSVLEIDESQFNSEVQDFIARISNDKKIFLFSIPGYVFLLYHIWLLQTGGISFPFEVPEVVYSSLGIQLYAAILFALVIYLIFASAYLAVNGIIFLKKISRFPIKIRLLQEGRKVKLDTVNRLILVEAIGWFIGVSLVMTVLFLYTSTAVFGFLAFVIAIGLLFFFAPQYFFHHSIRRSKENLLCEIESEFSLKARLPLSPDCNIMEALLLCTLFDHIDGLSEWAFEPQTLFKLFSSLIIPIIAALIGTLM